MVCWASFQHPAAPPPQGWVPASHATSVAANGPSLLCLWNNLPLQRGSAAAPPCRGLESIDAFQGQALGGQNAGLPHRHSPTIPSVRPALQNTRWAASAGQDRWAKPQIPQDVNLCCLNVVAGLLRTSTALEWHYLSPWDSSRHAHTPPAGVGSQLLFAATPTIWERPKTATSLWREASRQRRPPGDQNWGQRNGGHWALERLWRGSSLSGWKPLAWGSAP